MKKTATQLMNTLKELNFIKDWWRTREDASWQGDGSLMYTVFETDSNLISIGEETYGSESEFYIHARAGASVDKEGLLSHIWRALKEEGFPAKADRYDGKNISRVRVPVRGFKGWHWWE